jgi:hypothetical protein
MLTLAADFMKTAAAMAAKGRANQLSREFRPRRVLHQPGLTQKTDTLSPGCYRVVSIKSYYSGLCQHICTGN